MDDITFDSVAKAVSAIRSRRGTLRLLAGGFTGLPVALPGMLWPASIDVTAAGTLGWESTASMQASPPRSKHGVSPEI